MTDKMHALQPEPNPQLFEIVNQIIKPEAGVRQRGLAVAAQVIGDHGKMLMKVRGDEAPGVTCRANAVDQDQRLARAFNGIGAIYRFSHGFDLLSFGVSYNVQILRRSDAAGFHSAASIFPSLEKWGITSSAIDCIFSSVS